MAIEVNELREKLVERLKLEAGRIQGENHDERLQKLVLVHQAIQALDAAIAEGGPSEPPEPRIMGVNFR